MHPQEKWRQMSTQKLGQGTSLEAQWLGLCLPIQGVLVWSLVRELGFHMPCVQKAKRWNRSGIVTNSTKTLDMALIKKKPKTRAWISIAELFTVAKRWKQSKWPPSDEWINKRYIHTIEYYSVIKEIKSWYVLHHGWSLKTWWSVEEANHKNPHIVWFYLSETTRVGKSMETEGRLMFARGWGEGRKGHDCLKIFSVKMSGTGSRWWLHNAVNGLNVNTLFAWKWLILGTFSVVQQLRICLPVQGTQVWSLAGEDSTCHRVTKPTHHKYWTWALKSVPQLESLRAAMKAPHGATKTQHTQTHKFFF